MRHTDEAARRHLPRRAFFRSIRTRLAACFSLMFMGVLVLVGLLGLKGVPFSTYGGRVAAEKAEAFKSLNLIADIKKDRLVRWLEERRGDAHLAADSDLVETNVALLRAAIGPSSVREEEPDLWDHVRTQKSYLALQEFMDVVRTAYGIYDRILIADAKTGVTFVSTRDADLGYVVSQHPCFIGTMQAGIDFISDIDIDPVDDVPALFVGHVIDDIDVETLEDKEGEVVAVLMAEIHAEVILNPMLHTGEGLGRTGEALLVNRGRRILTSLKHRLPDGSTAKPLEYEIQAEPAVFAALGEEGIIEAKDYRGEPVLAAYRHIRVTPEFGWGMVIKRDKAELFAPMRTDVTYTALTGVFGIVAVVVLTGFLVRTLTRPIVSLGHTAEEVANGHLEARASVTGSDEVGVLATTFNSMIERIRNWRQELEEAVTARTAELKQANVELKGEMTERKRAEEAARTAQGQLLEQHRSETRRVQVELDKAREQLVRRTRLATVGQVSASIAHELRNPLGAIRNAAYYLKRRVPEDHPEFAEYLQIIDEETTAADRIINDLMAMTRPREPARQSVDVGRLAKEVFDRAVLPEGIRWRVSLDPDPFVLKADRSQLGQVITNLLTNAVQAMEGWGRVLLSASRLDDYDTIVFQDEGPGIARDMWERVFEPLVSTKAKGTGLGLTICRQIVELHGGTIESVDHDGQGAALRVRLPRTPPCKTAVIGDNDHASQCRSAEGSAGSHSR